MASVRKGSYVEPPMKYNAGLRKFEPDLPRKMHHTTEVQEDNGAVVVAVVLAVVVIMLILAYLFFW